MIRNHSFTNLQIFLQMPLLVDHNDPDRVHFSGFLINQSLQEFMLATNTSESETAEEKLRWAFKVYDKDSSGKVSCVNLVNEMMT